MEEIHRENVKNKQVIIDNIAKNHRKSIKNGAKMDRIRRTTAESGGQATMDRKCWILNALLAPFWGPFGSLLASFL